MVDYSNSISKFELLIMRDGSVNVISTNVCTLTLGPPLAINAVSPASALKTDIRLGRRTYRCERTVNST